MVETDASCGRLLEALEASGQAEDTIVIFSADNGPERYAYARDENYGHWSAQPWRGLKRDIYEGGHRVPFVVRWSGVVEAGAVDDSLVSQIDAMATLAAALDIELPKDAAEDSHNLLPLLRGEVDAARTSHIHNTFEDRYAFRDGDWLLIDADDGYSSARNPAWERKRDYPADDDSPVELYLLKDDPGQKRNLAAQHPEKVAEMRALLERIRERCYSAPRLMELF